MPRMITTSTKMTAVNPEEEMVTIIFGSTSFRGLVMFVYVVIFDEVDDC